MTTALPHSTEKRPARAGGRSRRRAVVLILVMTVLGILFVTGIAFMAVMNFESQNIRAERERKQAEVPVEAIVEDVENVLEEDLAATGAGAAFGFLPAFVTTYAEMPGVHNLFAPIEPFRPQPFQPLAFSWATDITALTQKPFLGSDMKLVLDPASPLFVPLIDTERGQSGVGSDPAFANFVPLDADGDGIVDSFRVQLVEANAATSPPQIAVGGAQLAALEKVLNPPSAPDDPVFLGLRIIAHGGMVDLSASAPTLIEEVLGPSSLSHFNPPYTPEVEEGSLRRRNFLPPSELGPTQVQGNPFSADPVGDGDFAAELFPNGEDLRKHRFWPFNPPDERGSDPAFPLWALRMDADLADPDPLRDEYDRRHLVTTISYDDLLARPTMVPIDDGTKVEEKDLISYLFDQQRKLLAANPALTTCQIVQQFPYLAYPSEPKRFPNTYRGDKRSDPNLDPFDLCACLRAGRDCTPNPRKGRLKLSLPWLDKVLSDGTITKQDQIELLQDAFTVMLLNARGSEWGSFQPDPYGGANKFWKHSFLAIEQTAAALTANLIDFADGDDVPTAVELWSADFNDLTRFGTPKGIMVFGLERQPFITEVVVQATDDGTGSVDRSGGQPVFFGVELFNPYGTDLKIAPNEYFLRTSRTPSPVAIPPITLPARDFMGFSAELPSSTVPPLPAGNFGAPSLSMSLEMDETSTVSLIRRVGPDDIVVDQFSLVGQTGSPKVGEWAPSGVAGTLGSSQRVASSVISPWYAPIPVDFSDSSSTTTKPSFGQRLGRSNAGSLFPVEVLLADESSSRLSDAFPTTGSLLLLMRHANSTSAPFTASLDDEKPDYPMDNGRMPVFDESFPDATGVRPYFHHVDPSVDPSVLDPITGLPTPTMNKPGKLMHLPWGQYVFDFFTALSLDSPGPYTSSSSTGVFSVDQNAPPKVDLAGLRVHGRINLNAAPWKVLSGVPVVAMDKIPVVFRNRFVNALGLSATPSNQPTPLGENLAKAIVAYRELREIDGDTGDYSVGGTPPMSPSGAAVPEQGRGWDVPRPAMRRGTGFMAVGELANVRNSDAALAFRFDAGVDPSTPNNSYLDAIALLASLSDWVTVRSDVFTIYGVLRGSPDPTIEVPGNTKLQQEKQLEDVQGRSLRFQKTVDRIPLILGKKEPRQIGERVIGKFTDAQSN